jgi:hypothetical protein
MRRVYENEVRSDIYEQSNKLCTMLYDLKRDAACRRVMSEKERDILLSMWDIYESYLVQLDELCEINCEMEE